MNVPSTSPRVGAQVEWLLDLFARPRQGDRVAADRHAVGETPSPHLLQRLPVGKGEAEAEEWVGLLTDLRDCE